MKKIFVLLALLVFALPSFAQKIDKVFEGTVANSATKTVYLNLDDAPGQRLDSIKVLLTYVGEIDLDLLTTTLGSFKGTGLRSSDFVAIATPDSTTLTVDVAAAGTGGVRWGAAGLALATSNLHSTGGFDALKISVVAGSSGNDATDPNKLIIRTIRYYTAMK